MVIFIVFTTAPELEIPVKLPEVAFEMFPLIILPFIVNAPHNDRLVIPVKPDEPLPLITQFKMLLLFIVIVDVLKGEVIPWLLIAITAPEAALFVSVTVLLLIVVVIVPVG